LSRTEQQLSTIHDVLRRAGVQYDHYKLTCIERRIAARMRLCGVGSYDEYTRVLQSDPAEARQLERALTINVTRFFRNWSAFHALATSVVPELWRRDESPIRVWSAGCASGEEAYSVAALFHDHALQIGEVHRVSRVEVVGSDVDEESLAAAHGGRYPAAAVAEAPDHLRERYLQISRGTALVDDRLRALVHFERRDLVLDREPWAAFDLILCRNVLIYLDARAQEALFERFHRCTVRGAYLMLGKVEAVLGRARSWFKPVNIRARIYRREPDPRRPTGPPAPVRSAGWRSG
jgi:chemotaxis methyl-accepting protein methylase